MILIGTMDWASTRMKGAFACPNCGSRENFRLRTSRPFLTLYFVPILPIGGLQEFVQCVRCKNSFESEILASRMMTSSTSNNSMAVASHSMSDFKGETREFQADLLKVIALMMVEDGQVTEDEIRIARRLYENITNQNLSREELGQMCALVKQQRLNTLNFLSTAAERRTHEEKLLLVQAMFGVAGADGEISPGRLHSLVEAHEILGIDEIEFQQAVADTERWLR